MFKDTVFKLCARVGYENTNFYIAFSVFRVSQGSVATKIK